MTMPDKVYLLVVTLKWGTVDLGFYTAEQIQAFRDEFTGQQGAMAVFDPLEFSVFIKV